MTSDSASAEVRDGSPSAWNPAFLRCLAAMGLGAASLAILDWSRPAIDSPGPLPLLLLASALVFTGPPRSGAASRGTALGIAALLGVALWGASGALGWPAEKNAALLALPLWGIAAGCATLGVVLNGTGRAFVLAGLCTVGAARAAADVMQGPTSELVWWCACFAWIAATMLPSGTLRRSAGDSMPLVAGVLWFVLLIAALTVQEIRHPLARYGALDDSAAVDAIRSRPITGFGGGAFDGAMAGFTRRNLDVPILDASEQTPPAYRRPEFATRAILRLCVDIGVPAAIAAIAGLVLVFAFAVGRTRWTRERAAALGAAGFWVAALLSSRQPWIVPLALACFAVPAALGRADRESAVPHPAQRSRWAFQSWGIAVVLLAVPAVLFPAARAHWKKQDVLADPKAGAMLANWAVPWQEKAWAIRARSQEIAKYADPRDWLEPVVAEWLRVEPHSEMAWVEHVRLAEKRGGAAAAEKAAMQAHERLPSSAVFMLWVARARVEQGRTADAVAFLEEAVRDRQSIHPGVQSRIVELRLQMARETRK